MWLQRFDSHHNQFFEDIFPLDYQKYSLASMSSAAGRRIRQTLGSLVRFDRVNQVHLYLDNSTEPNKNQHERPDL
jgi:hypothetical protein